MSVKYALLGLLAESPRHGYDLKQAFEQKVGVFWTLNFGQIYSTLERLYEEGLVAYEAVAQSDKPDKKIYRITAEGSAAFESWRLAPIKAEPRALRDELFLKLMFMRAEDVETLLLLLHSQQSVYMAQMMQLTERKVRLEQQAKRALQSATDAAERARIHRERVISTLLIDVALQHAEADIRWLRHCEAKIKALFSEDVEGGD